MMIAPAATPPLGRLCIGRYFRPAGSDFEQADPLEALARLAGWWASVWVERARAGPFRGLAISWKTKEAHYF